MMNIKSIIKQFNVTLTEFSQLLNISRPTLDGYISDFENGNEIFNEKYQIVFDRLFKKDISTEEQFKNELKKFNHMLERERVLGTTNLNPHKTDIITFLIEDMKKDLYSDDSNEDVYIFIKILLNNYKKENGNKDFYQFIIDYILVLNSHKEIEKITTEEQKILAIYNNFFREILEGKYLFKEQYMDRFLGRIKEIKENRKNKEDELKNQINDLVQKEIKRQIKMGNDPGLLSLEEIMKKIKSN